MGYYQYMYNVLEPIQNLNLSSVYKYCIPVNSKSINPHVTNLK